MASTPNSSTSDADLRKQVSDLIAAITHIGEELNTTNISLNATRIEQTDLRQFVKEGFGTILRTGSGSGNNLRREEPHGENSRINTDNERRRENQYDGGRDRHPPNMPPVRLDPSCFNGDDPSGWIQRIQTYFDYYGTTDTDHLYLVTLFVNNPASDWLQYFKSSNSNATWDTFLLAARQRFDPSFYENYTGTLSKLCQTGTVQEYQAAFESLLNKVTGLSDESLKAMYIAGLKQPVQRELNIQKPPTLAATFLLASGRCSCTTTALVVTI